MNKKRLFEFNTLVCRIFVCILFTMTIQICHSQTKAEGLTISFKETPLREAISKIESVSNYTFFYDSNLVNLSQIVSLTARNQDINSAMRSMLIKTDISYEITNRQIALFPKIKQEATTNQTPLRVGGVVRDSKGEPIIGATVMLKGTTTGVSTSADGSYAITVAMGSALEVNYVGYIPADIVVVNSSNQNIVLTEDVLSIDEVVVVGYGTQKKVNLTGSVTSVKIDENMSSRSLTNLSSGLAGMVPGLQVQQTSGQPGRDGASIKIRGMGTVNNTNPLVVVDGMPDIDMNRIDMNDIESISVLKDAASAAIYGSRAANGVILITTKRGKEGKMNINYTGSYAITQASNNYKLTTNHAKGLDMIDRASMSGGVVRQFTQGTMDMWMSGSKVDPTLYPSTDWWGLMYQKGSISQHNVSASGGSEKISFYGSLGYMKNNGTAYKTNFERTTARLNIDAKISKRFKASMSVDGQWTNQFSPTTYGLTNDSAAGEGIYNASPGMLPRHPETGVYGWIMTPNENPQNTNFMAFMESQNNSSRNQQFNASGSLSYKILEGLIVKADVSVNMTHRFNRAWNNGWESTNFQLAQVDPIRAENPHTPALNLSNNYNTALKTNNVLSLNYNKQIGKHTISALAGYTEEAWRDNWFSGSATERLHEDIFELDGTSKVTQTVGGDRGAEALRSFFGRVNYSYNDKYLFEANLRRDESSKFTKGHRAGIFPSFSAGWRISEEPFMKPVKQIITNLKLRASWGELGNNSGVGRWEQASVYGNAFYPLGQKKTQGVVPTKYINEDLTWETTRVTNIGLDFTLYDMVNFEIDLYNKHTVDMIRPMDMSSLMSGFSAPKKNIGEMLNRGIEANVTYYDKTGDFTWSVTANGSINENKLLKWNEKLLKGGRYIGIPYGSMYTNKHTMIAQTYDDIYNSPWQGTVNLKPGDILYEDRNGDGQVNDRDETILYGATGKYYVSYGLNATVSWKYIDLSLFFQGDAGRQSMWNVRYNNINTVNRGNAPSDIFADTWRSDYRDAQYPRLLAGSFSNNKWGSTYWLKPMDYLRLKNLQLGFNLPNKICKDINIQQIRIFLSAENLFTITKWKGIDPEKDEGRDVYPMLKTYSLGMNLTF